MSGRVLIVGASRGLGREFARQYAEAGWQVVAAMRRPSADGLPAGVRAVPVDVLDPAAVAALAAAESAPLDLLVVSAGVMGRKTARLESPPQDEFDLVMRTNVLGPLRLIEAFAPRIRSAGGTIAVLTSRMGSIGDAESAYSLLYRASKAAANMVVHCAALDLGVRVVALHPGWVRTDMGGPDAPLEAPEPVAGLRRVIADPARWPGGGFYNHLGDTLPW